MTNPTSTFRHRSFFPLLAATLLSTGVAVSLSAQNAPLRERLSASLPGAKADTGPSAKAEAVYARTPAEAQARILEDMRWLWGEPAPVSPIDAADLSELGLCRSALRQDERAALASSFTHKPNWAPTLGLGWRDSSDYAAEREQVAKILGAARHREVEATCQSLERDQRERAREAAILTLSRHYGLSESQTEQVRALVREREQALGALSESPNESYAEDYEGFTRKNDELSRRFRELLGQEVWARYKTEVLWDYQSGNPPLLNWLTQDLFSLPEDEAPRAPQPQ